MEYQTAHLLVRRLREEDREAIIQLLTDPIVTKTYMVPDCSEDGKAESLFERLMELSHRADRYISAIVLEDRLIGLLNETEVSERSIELGYAILPAYHNRGYGTEVLQGAIAYLFAHGFTRVVTGAFSENHASLRIMEKCGMTKQLQTDTVEYRGKTHLCVYYAAERPYYEAYDDRYRQVHEKNLQWFDEGPSAIVGEVIAEFGITKAHKLWSLVAERDAMLYTCLSKGLMFLRQIYLLKRCAIVAIKMLALQIVFKFSTVSTASLIKNSILFMQ